MHEKGPYVFVYNTSPNQPTHKYRLIWAFMPALVDQLDALSDWRPGGRGFNPAKGGNILSWRLFSKVILPLPLIQEG